MLYGNPTWISDIDKVIEVVPELDRLAGKSLMITGAAGLVCSAIVDMVKPFELPSEEREKLIRNNPEYGRIICRCETITEGEIIDAIRRPLGAKSLDGVKRRTRAGMGRCQGGFCSPRVMDILSRELGVPLESITKSGGDSKILTGRTKDEG